MHLSLSVSLLGHFFFPLIIDFMHSASSIIDLKIACSTNYCFGDNFVSCIGNVAFFFGSFKPLDSVSGSFACVFCNQKAGAYLLHISVCNLSSTGIGQ